MQPQRYWREIPKRYRYEASRCTKCGKIFFPGRLVCDACQHREFEMVTLPRTGKVLTYTVIHVAPSQFKTQTPYAMGVVELDNKVKLTTQIVDCDLEKLDVGMKVKLEFRKIQVHHEQAVAERVADRAESPVPQVALHDGAMHVPGPRRNAPARSMR